MAPTFFDSETQTKLLAQAKIGYWRVEYPSRRLTLTGAECVHSLIGNADGYLETTMPDFLNTYCHPKDIGFIQEQIGVLISTGIVPMPDFRVYNKQTNEWRWAKLFGHECIKIDESHLVLTGGMQDFGELTGFEASLAKMRRVEETSQIVLDAIPFCFSLWSKNYECVDCNIASTVLFDLPSKQDYLDSFFKLSPEFQPNGQLSSENILVHLKEAFETGYALYEWMHQKLNGEPIPSEIHMVRVEQYGEYVVAGFTRDMRELKSTMADMRAVEEDLREARDLAESSTRAKSEFLANMSHEIRTPMNAILGMTHLLLQMETTAKQRFYLEKTEYSSKLLLRIINDILDFSKIEAGQVELENTCFSIEDVLREVRSVVADTIASKNLAFNVELDPSAPTVILGDSLRLSQVLLNLVSNAVKFTETGSVSVRVTVQKAGKQRMKFLFCIKDTGIGMTPDQMNCVFSIFKQADTSTTRKYGGTGLGLSICKSLASLMNGDVWCESTVGHGTTFYFAADLDVASESEQLLSKDLINNKKILLIGDDSNMLSMLEARLKALHCNNIVTQLELESFDKRVVYDTQDAFLIIMDWLDTERDAYNALVNLKDLMGENLPPILCTSTSDSFERHELLLQYPSVRILTKPFTLSSLYDEILKVTGVEITSKPQAEKVKRVGFKRILLVEDNEINQILATELLKTQGYIIDVASNGLEAIQLLQEKEPGYDLVLMDIQMPVMDGLTATREIRKLAAFKDLPILAMTAHAMSGDLEQSQSAGMNDHITKPINPDVLFATISKWL